MRFFFGQFPGFGSGDEAIPLYGRGEFESPTRSTIPMLSLLIHAPEKFQTIVRQLNMPDCYDICLEHQVRPPRGKGKASHTDVMVRWKGDALGIEAKWTEPIGKSVAIWRADGKDRSNRDAVLDGWLGLLRDRLQIPLYAADFDGVLYQMLHRAASAAVSESPRLAYFLFRPSDDPRTAQPDEVFRHLGILWDKLGKPASFPFAVVEIPLNPTEAYEQLRSLPKGEPSTAKAIIAALQDPATPLFDFGEAQIRLVGGGPDHPQTQGNHPETPDSSNQSSEPGPGQPFGDSE